MKNSKHAFVALLAVLAAGAAGAQSMNKNSGYYGEVGYSALKFDDGFASPTPKLARFIVGKNLNENLDLEGMLAFTVAKDTWQSGTTRGELTAATLGVYAKPKIEIAKSTEVFARIGLANTAWKSNNTNGNSSDSFIQLAYGIGIQTEFTKNVYGQVDYMDLGKHNTVSATGVTLSVGVRF